MQLAKLPNLLHQELLNFTEVFSGIQLPLTLEGFMQDLKELLVELYKGMKNPQWLLMRCLCRWGTVRWLVRRWVSTSYPLHYSTGESSIFGDLDVSAIVKRLETDGLYLGLCLPPTMVQEICNFAYHTSCYGNRKPTLGFYYSKEEQIQHRCQTQFLTGYYFNTTQSCPAIKKLAQDPKLLEIAAQYLQAAPKHLGNHLWWSFTTDASLNQRRRAAQLFHYDLDDYRFLKFFFYLTDVDAWSGPHQCIRGSHKGKKFRHQLRRRGYSDHKIFKDYGQHNLVTILGKAGYGFVEDPLCFHKGVPPKKQDRLMLQIEYALHDYGMQSDRFEALRCTTAVTSGDELSTVSK